MHKCKATAPKNMRAQLFISDVIVLLLAAEVPVNLSHKVQFNIGSHLTFAK